MNLILLVFMFAHSLAVTAMSLESVKFSLQERSSRDSNLLSPIVVQKGVFTIFRWLKVRSSLTSVTTIVRRRQFVKGNMDFCSFIKVFLTKNTEILNNVFLLMDFCSFIKVFLTKNTEILKYWIMCSCLYVFIIFFLEVNTRSIVRLDNAYYVELLNFFQ